MTTPTPTPAPTPAPIPTQTPLPPLARALDLLDGLLLRDDIPLDARLDITEVFTDLLDVRPPFPPTTPHPDTTHAGTTDAAAAAGAAGAGAGSRWTDGVAEAVAALQQLTREHGVDLTPAVVVGYALAARRLRRTLDQQTPAAS